MLQKYVFNLLPLFELGRGYTEILHRIYGNDSFFPSWVYVFDIWDINKRLMSNKHNMARFFRYLIGN